MYKKLFSIPIHIHLLGLAITTNLFSSDNQMIANGSIFVLPQEIVLKVVIRQEKPDYDWIEKLTNYFDLQAYTPQVQQYVLPCYRLLMTCRGFYFYQELKQSFCKTILLFPQHIQNIFVLYTMAKESHPIQELNITESHYIKDWNINNQQRLFLQTNLDKIIFVRNRSAEKFLSIPEFLISNMNNSFNQTSLKTGFNHPTIGHVLRNHFELFNYICKHANLSLPSLASPHQSIAEFLLNNLSGENHICKMVSKVDSNKMSEAQIATYKKRNSVDVIPEEITLDLTLFLSDQAFEKLCSAAKNNSKEKEYNKKLLNWILPKLPAGHIQQSWHTYFIRRIRNLLSILFTKVFLLISMIKDSFYNHI